MYILLFHIGAIKCANSNFFLSIIYMFFFAQHMIFRARDMLPVNVVFD